MDGSYEPGRPSLEPSARDARLERPEELEAFTLEWGFPT